MLRTTTLIAVILLSDALHAQVRFGAFTGWSHSKQLDQGGPIVGMLADAHYGTATVRGSFTMQLPTTHFISFVDDGSGRMLSAGGWNDGHTRFVRGSTAMSMFSASADYLMLIDTDRPSDRIELLLGPGIEWAVEGIRTERHITDRTDSTFTLERWDGQRRSANLRATLGANYRLPFGSVVVEATTQVISFATGAHIGGSSWFQRQTIRIGAVFPISNGPRKDPAPAAP